MNKQKYPTLFIFIMFFAYSISSYELIAMQNAKESCEMICIVPYDDYRDRQAILSIIDACPHYLSYEFAGKPAGTTEKYLTNQNHFTFVLRKNGRTIGFINYEYSSNKRQGSIYLLGVNRNNQGKGYGRMLLEYALKNLQELNALEVSLTVNHDNKNAHSLYEKAGFTAVSKSSQLRIWCYTKKLGINK